MGAVAVEDNGPISHMPEDKIQLRYQQCDFQKYCEQALKGAVQTVQQCKPQEFAERVFSKFAPNFPEFVMCRKDTLFCDCFPLFLGCSPIKWKGDLPTISCEFSVCKGQIVCLGAAGSSTLPNKYCGRTQIVVASSTTITQRRG